MEDFSTPAGPIEDRAPRFRKPADYYSTPPVDTGKGGVPRSAKIGCGLAGLIFMVVMFVGASVVSTSGAGRFMGFLFSRLEGELEAMAAPGVAPAERAELQRQMKILAQKTERKEVGLVSLQPLLRELNQAARDKQLSAEEVRSLTGVLRDLNNPPGAKPPAR